MVLGVLVAPVFSAKGGTSHVTAHQLVIGRW